MTEYCNLIGPHSVVQWDMVHQTLILSVIVEEDLACKSNVHLTLILIHNNIITLEFCAICTFVGEKMCGTVLEHKHYANL